MRAPKVSCCVKKALSREVPRQKKGKDKRAWSLSRGMGRVHYHLLCVSELFSLEHLPQLLAVTCRGPLQGRGRGLMSPGQRHLCSLQLSLPSLPLRCQ